MPILPLWASGTLERSGDADVCEGWIGMGNGCGEGFWIAMNGMQFALHPSQHRFSSLPLQHRPFMTIVRGASEWEKHAKLGHVAKLIGGWLSILTPEWVRTFTTHFVPPYSPSLITKAAL
jgi:hypothetical protein